MKIDEWQRSAIDWFRSNKATDEHWETMASALMHISECSGLYGDLDDAIEQHAEEMKGDSTDE